MKIKKRIKKRIKKLIANWERKFLLVKRVRHYFVILGKFEHKDYFQIAAPHLLKISPPKFLEKLLRERFFRIRLEAGYIKKQIEFEKLYDFNDKFTSELKKKIQEFATEIGDIQGILGCGLDFKFSQELIREFLDAKIGGAKSKSECAQFVAQLIKKHGPIIKEKFVLLSLLDALKTHYPDLIVEFADDLIKGANGRIIASTLSKKYSQMGDLYVSRKYLALARARNINGFKPLSFVSSRINLLENGYAYKTMHNMPVASSDYKDLVLNKSAKYRALYFLHNTLPYDSGGYATRAQGLVKGMFDSKYEVNCVSRLSYPKDIKSEIGECRLVDDVDGVQYYRLPSDRYPYPQTPLSNYMDFYTAAALPLVEKLNPTILHAASNFMNGLVINALGRILKLPTVYEIRGLWEVTRVSRQSDVMGSPLFKMFERLETQAAVDAAQVITITRALKEEMVRRGVPEDKITILPNGVSCAQFTPITRNQDLAAKLDINQAACVFGYIGSVVDYEGLDLLIDAAVQIKKLSLINDPVYLIVGDGAVWERLKESSVKKGVASQFRFTGRVPHHEVNQYYSLITAMIYPRKPLPVCEMVSPIKPLEAMAMEKTIIASDVDAIAEMVTNEVTGLLFKKGNLESLIARMTQVNKEREYAHNLGVNGRNWVNMHRDWRHLAKILEQVYEKALLHQS